jgi:uncharacterized protein (DUF2336 family)
MTDYPTLAQARAAGLFHPNCRHSMSAYIEGVTKPYGETEDPQGYKDTQKLRYLERQVRESKRLEAAALDPAALRKAKMRTAAYQAKIRTHVATSKAKRQPWRESYGVKD